MTTIQNRLLLKLLICFIIFAFVVRIKRMPSANDSVPDENSAFIVKSNQILIPNTREVVSETQTAYITVFLIMCRQKKKSRDTSSDPDRQLTQVQTLLKTIYLFTHEKVKIMIVNNDPKFYDQLLSKLHKWKVDFSNKLIFQSVDVRYPQGMEGMISMYRLCATARLFLPDLLPRVDAGIFLDTDMVLHDDLANLWSHWRHMTASQLAGMTAVQASYGFIRRQGEAREKGGNKIQDPHYFGPPGVGINAGIMMMNLTRMRRMSGGGWTEAVRYVFSKLVPDKSVYVLPLADQDLLNEMFSTHPRYLYELPCEWNYVYTQCRPDTYRRGIEGNDHTRLRIGLNQCPGAADHGISLLHGNAQTFVRKVGQANREESFLTIYEFWKRFRIGEDHLEDRIKHLRSKLTAMLGAKFQPDRGCLKVKGIVDIFLKNIENMIELNHFENH